MVRAELSYALEYAEEAPSNESPWNYVRGFFRTGQREYADFPEVRDRVLKLQVIHVAVHGAPSGCVSCGVTCSSRYRRLVHYFAFLSKPSNGVLPLTSFSQIFMLLADGVVVRCCGCAALCELPQIPGMKNL